MAEGDRVLATAAAAAAAALGAAPSTAQPSGREALQRLFPGCTYLALGVGRLQPATEGNSANSEPLLLLGSILLSGCAEGKASPAAVHLLRGSLAGSAILAGRPLTCQTAAQPGGGGDRGAVAASAWSDTSQAVQLCGAQSFLCLPFRLAGMRQEHGQGAGAAAACGSSGSSSRDGDVGSRQACVVAALLLGLARPAAGQQLHQQHEQHLQGGSQPWTQRLRVLVQLAAALVRHAQPELSEAAEGLAVLLAAAPAAGPISDEEEDWEREGKTSDPETAEQEEEVEPEEGGGEAAEVAAAAGGAAAVAPLAVAVAEPAAGTAGGASEPSSSRPRSAGDASAVAQGQGACASLAALPAGATGTLPPQQPQPQASNGSGRAAPAEAGAGPEATPGARLPACMHTVLQLCHATLAPLLQLLSSRRGMPLDWLLRFREAGPGGWEPPGGLSPASNDGSGASRGSDAQEQQAWVQQAQQALLGPEPLEQQFLRYHARLMADKVDAAGSLILLAILVLLSKEPSCRVRLGEPAFCAMAAVLALPLAALLPGAPRAWYVRRREQVLQLFFLVTVLYQQAVHNFLDSHTSRASQARYVNAGFAWITVDGVLLQMRFCRQLPTLLACFLLNLRAISEVCERFHAHLDPRRCAASGFLRGVLCLLMPLAITYLLELRMRRNWLLRRQAQAAQADAEVQQALRAQRQRERQDARLARAAGAGASSSGQ